MDWLVDLFTQPSIAHAILVLSLAIALGLALGSVKIGGISLGVGGVLFSGLALGHLGLRVEHSVMEFAREFGLILFVYAIGLQVGPGFFASLRRQGLALNLMAVTIVVGGSLLAVALGFALSLDFDVVVGVLAGAVTNTPSLGAAQQALKDSATASGDAAQLVGLGYAVAYPGGILGTILTMVIVRKLFRINPDEESAQLERSQACQNDPIVTRNVEVSNANLAGRSIEQLGDLTGLGVVVTRIYHRGSLALATPKTVLEVGDILHAVGTAKRLDDFVVIVGRESALELSNMRSPIAVRRVVVTRKDIVGGELGELNLADKFGVIATRVTRSGVEFSPKQDFRLQFGDRLVIVGVDAALERAASALGDSVKELDTPHIIPIFVGIAIGVIVGSIPFAVPGVPAPVKLGLAGGPLLVAIGLGRIGKLGPLLSYMPNPAKTLLKEFGIALFLAAVGLRSGERFVEALLTGDGLRWMAMAIVVTMVPILLVGIYARRFRKLNYLALCGVLSGSMTDPPALAYSTQVAHNDSPSVAYATVYPLTMLLRVVMAQVIVIFAFG